MGIRLENINKNFDGCNILNNINISLPKGKLSVLLGPSGCGKTTLLRTIAGLEPVESGKIFFENIDVTEKAITEKKIGFVFQNYALFNNMNISNNIAFGLNVLPKKLRPTKEEINVKVNNLLKLIKLEHLAKAYPNKLSGGQKQRVALARALAISPKFLLLDEPFGALDAKVRKEMRQWLSLIHKEFNITTILVTHDQEEAIEMADNIVIMNEGKIEQFGEASELYNNPSNKFVAEFIGEINVFNHEQINTKNLVLENYCKENIHINHNYNNSSSIYIRPHELNLYRDQVPALTQAEVIKIHSIGPTVKIIMATPVANNFITALITQNEYNERNYQIGEKLYLQSDKYFILN